MRILVISHYFWPENFRINDLATEFASRGHEVTVLTGYPNYPSGEIFHEFRQTPENFSQFGAVRVVRVPLLPRGKGGAQLIMNYVSFAASATLIGAWRLRNKTYDVIFVFEPSPITVGLPAVFLRYLKRAPVAFWVLDIWPETLEAVGAVRSKSILKMVGKLVSFIYKRCDLILAQSRSFIPQILKHCEKEGRVEYFPSWSDAIFDFDSVTAAPEVHKDSGFFDIMFAGNIGEAQDFPAIIDAAARLKENKNIRWLIVGDGRASEWVQSEIQKRGLEQRVFMLGRYPVERMPSFYKCADALLVSLRDEPIFSMTIPGKLQSYLAAGIPILAMLNGEGAEIVQKSGAGLACLAGNPGALAEAALTLSRMTEEERKTMGARGIELSKTEFDRDHLISRLLSWFDNLAENNHSKKEGIL